jgi:cell division protein FtsZ
MFAMAIGFTHPEVEELRPRISVIGVGGAGGNAIANMIASDVQGVDFIVANTDAQALNASAAEQRIQLGLKITQGLGAGSRPDIGRAAAEETLEEILRSLEGAHMCFIAAGMGGGTGTGAAPVIAKAAKEMGILTVGVVTKPFSFEGTRRTKSADAGIEELQKHVDTLIVIPNQNLFLIANPNTTFKEAFKMADEVLQQGVRGITDLMVMPGLINLDFADVRSVMEEMGKAMMGTGEASGDHRAIEAAERAIANPLLDGVSMKGAKGVIISITGGDDMRLMEVDEAANHIKELVDPDANIIWGSAFNPELEGKIRVSVVATGIEAESMTRPEQAPARVFSFPPTVKAPAPVETAPVAATQPEVAPAPAQAPIVESAFDAAPVAVEPVAVEAAPVFAPEPVYAPAPVLSFTDPAVADDDTTLELETPLAPAPIVAPADELQLEPTHRVAPEPEAYAQPEPEIQPTRSWLGGQRAAEAPAAPAPRAGGTLFERMSSLARGTAARPADPVSDTNPLDIPRFLNKQNNQ